MIKKKIDKKLIKKMKKDRQKKIDTQEVIKK